jgi:hypothetical protein
MGTPCRRRLEISLSAVGEARRRDRDRLSGEAGGDALPFRHPAQIRSSAEVATFGLAAHGGLVLGGRGEGDLIVVAAGGQRLQRRLLVDPPVEPGLTGGGQGHLQIDVDPTRLASAIWPRSAIRPSETSTEAVAVSRITSAKIEPGRRAAIVIDKGGDPLMRQRKLALNRLQAQPAVADEAGDEDQVARTGAGAADRPPLGRSSPSWWPRRSRDPG